MNISKEFVKLWKPQRPLATNQFKQGVYRHSRTKALTMKYIELQPSTHKNTISIDLDSDEAESIIKTAIYDDEIIPEPSYYTINPESKHAHIIYFTEGFTQYGTKARRYQDAIEKAITRKLKGDPAYNHRITRNPLTHPTQFLNNHEYSFKELATSINLKEEPKQKTKKEFEIHGRNDYVFKQLKEFSYFIYRHTNYNPQSLQTLLEQEAQEINQSIPEELKMNPLTQSETNRIIKSIHKFTTAKFTKEEFSKIQTQRINKRWKDHDLNIDKIIQLKEEGLSFTQIANELNIKTSTAKQRYYRHKPPESTLTDSNK